MYNKISKEISEAIYSNTKSITPIMIYFNRPIVLVKHPLLRSKDVTHLFYYSSPYKSWFPFCGILTKKKYKGKSKTVYKGWLRKYYEENGIERGTGSSRYGPSYMKVISKYISKSNPRLNNIPSFQCKKEDRSDRSSEIDKAALYMKKKLSNI